MRDIRNYYILALFLLFVFILDITLVVYFIRYQNVNMNYIKLKNNEKVEEKYNNSNPCLIGVLAPWCGYCKKLKESKVLEEVSKEYKVIILDDKHPQARKLMQQANCKGFPCLMIHKNGKIEQYKKSRDYKSIISALK